MQEQRNEVSASKLSKIRDSLNVNNAVTLKDVIDYIPYRLPKKTIKTSDQEEKTKSEFHLSYRSVRIIISIILAFIALIIRITK